MADGPARTDAVIAGVNKAGTTSLFVSLSTHPDVAPSAIKETRYFLPARYGQALDPFTTYQDYFRDAGTRPVRLEATPSYFYGGAAVATKMSELLTNPRVLLILREPVSRALSFFAYQKVRLRFPGDMSIADYLTAADALTDDDFRDPENEKYLAFRGGCYADFLPAWLETFGTDRLRVMWFEGLVSDPAAVVDLLAEWIGLDPLRFPNDALSSENRTTGFKNKAFQGFALKANDRLERLLRRHPEAKRKLRAFYYQLNGKPVYDEIPQPVREELAERYREPNARLVQQLVGAGIQLPGWLSGERRSADHA